MLQPADVRCWTEKSYINIYATPMRNKLAMLITIIISIIIIVIMGGLLYLEDFLSDSLLQRGKIIACFSVFVCRDT